MRITVYLNATLCSLVNGTNVSLETVASVFREEMLEPYGRNYMLETLVRPNYTASPEEGNLEGLE